MKKFLKRMLAFLLVVSLLSGGGYGAWYYNRTRNRKEIPVYPVTSLRYDFDLGDTNLEGSICTSVTQNVNVEENEKILEVFVNPGDHVTKGMKLVELDMTLREMEQNINRLTLLSYDQNLQKALARLYSLQNGGPIEAESDSSLSGVTDDSVPDDPIETTSSGTKSRSASGTGMLLLTAAPLRLMGSIVELAGDLTGSEAAVSDAEETEVTEETEEEEKTEERSDSLVENVLGIHGEAEQEHPELSLEPIEEIEELEGTAGDGDEEDIFSQEFDYPFYDFPIIEENNMDDQTDPDVTPTPIPTPTQEPTPTPEGTPTPTPTVTPEPEDDDIRLYHMLDEDSEAVLGTGTEADPLIYLCDASYEQVVLRGTFLNLMAGYDAQGQELLHEGGYWYSLRFYYPEAFYSGTASGSGEMETDPDFPDTEDWISEEEGTGSSILQGEELLDAIENLCVGYYLINGGEPGLPVDPDSEVVYTLEGSIIPDTPDDTPDDWGYYDNTTETTLSREEAIKQQKRTVTSIQLNIRKMNLNIRKLDEKLENRVIYSSIDGVVKMSDDTDTSSGTVLSVESDAGFYIKGKVSEMYLDQFAEGTVINCYSYTSGERFEAVVESVSDYPVDAGSDYGMSFYGYGSNSNASSYEFIATIEDQSLALSVDDWLEISFRKSESGTKPMNIIAAFIREENRQSFVYKEENGVLKKQYVKAGVSKDGGYTIPVSAGVSETDYLAFPYGKGVEDGAPVRIADISELTGGLY